PLAGGSRPVARTPPGPLTVPPGRASRPRRPVRSPGRADHSRTSTHIAPVTAAWTIVRPGRLTSPGRGSARGLYDTRPSRVPRRAANCGLSVQAVRYAAQAPRTCYGGDQKPALDRGAKPTTLTRSAARRSDPDAP